MENLGNHLARLREATLRINDHPDGGSLRQEIVDQACFLTQATYGALLTFDENGEAAEFLTSGMTPEQASLIEPSPRGRGLLGSLDGSDKPLRIKDIGSHPDSVGFPGNHPAMKSFLGMPMRLRGVRLANLYLADKQTGSEFTVEDEEMMCIFAAQAAFAMSNAREYDRLLSANTELENLIEASPMGVFVFDAFTGVLTSLNKEAQRIIDFSGLDGVTPDDAMKVLTVLRPDGSELPPEEFPAVRVMGTGETVRAQELTIHFPNGKSLHTLVNAAPVYSSEGEIVSIAFGAQDISPLEEMDRMQSDFLNLVSHELRTPLSTIKGSVSALADALAQSSSSESHQLLKIIDLQADLMRVQINGLSDLTQIETGTLAINQVSLDPSSLLKDVCLEFQALNRGREVRADLVADLPKVMVDRQRMGQALHTLLLCALKCSPPSSPLNVCARREDAQIAVTIATEGMVAPDTELYEIIQQISRNQITGGVRNSGRDRLSLAVCKGVLNAHGGTLWVECGESGEGMTLGFTIPAADEPVNLPVGSSSPALDRSLPVEASKARILSVMDSPRMLGAVQRTLSRVGYVPIGSLDFADVDRLIAEEKPHLVLLDLTEPHRQDFELIEKVTQGYGVPAIVLSGQGDDESIVRAFELGADDYIVKPFSPSELIARIQASFRKRSDSFQPRGREEYVIGDVVINYPERKVTVSGRKVHLTATEYQLLYELSTKAGRVLSQDELLRRIWGEEYTGDIQLLRAFVKTLRQKLGDNARRPTYIFTEHGIGYRMPKT